MNHDDEEIEDIFSDIDESDITEEPQTIESNKPNNELLKKATNEIIQNRIQNSNQNNIQNNNKQDNIQNNAMQSKKQNQTKNTNNAPKMANNMRKKTSGNNIGLPGNIKEKLANARNKNKNLSSNQLGQASNAVDQMQNEQQEKEIENKQARQTAMTGATTGNALNKIKNSKANQQVKKELGSMIVKQLLTKKVVLIGGLVAVIVVVLILFVSVILSSVSDDESEVNTSNEVIGIITGNLNFDDITEYLVNMGICQELSDKQEEKQACEASDFGQFLLYFKGVYEDYQNKLDKNNQPIKLDIPLLLETISYYRADNTLMAVLKEENSKVTTGVLLKNSIYTELDDLSQALVEEAEEYGDLYTCSGNNCSSCTKKNDVVYKKYYRISDDKYVSYLKFGKVHENYSGKSKLYDVDINPDSDSKCIPQGRAYNPPSDVRYEGTISEDTTNNTNSNITQITGNGKGVDVANLALKYIGNKYLWGGTDLNNGIDCSGFTMRIFEQFGISLPHSSADQRSYGNNVGTNLSNAIPGDLLCYQGHVGIYIGNNQMISALGAKWGITTSKADYKSIISIRRLV